MAHVLKIGVESLSFIC